MSSEPRDKRMELSDVHLRALCYAIRERKDYLRKHAAALTLKDVRRILEKDLGLHVFALDTHQAYIKQRLNEVLHNSSAAEIPDRDSRDEVKFRSDGRDDTSVGNPKPSDKKSVKKINEATKKESGEKHGEPVMQFCTMSVPPSVYKRAKHVPRNECEESMIKKMGEIPQKEGFSSNPSKKAKMLNERKDKKMELSDVKLQALCYAIRARKDYIREHADVLTLKGVRRILEEDLGLHVFALDTHQAYINRCLDEDFEVGPREKTTEVDTCKLLAAIRESSSYLRCRKRELTLESFRRSLETKMRLAARTLDPYLHMIRMEVNEVLHNSGAAEIPDRGSRDEVKFRADGRDDTSVGHPKPSDKKSVQKISETPKKESGQKHGEPVMRFCTMSVPPAVYKRAKHVPRNECEESMINKMGEIPQKEGFSSNPSKKDPDAGAL